MSGSLSKGSDLANDNSVGPSLAGPLEPPHSPPRPRGLPAPPRLYGGTTELGGGGGGVPGVLEPANGEWGGPGRDQNRNELGGDTHPHHPPAGPGTPPRPRELGVAALPAVPAEDEEEDDEEEDEEDEGDSTPAQSDAATGESEASGERGPGGRGRGSRRLFGGGSGGSDEDSSWGSPSPAGSSPDDTGGHQPRSPHGTSAACPTV